MVGVCSASGMVRGSVWMSSAGFSVVEASAVAFASTAFGEASASVSSMARSAGVGALHAKSLRFGFSTVAGSYAGGTVSYAGVAGADGTGADDGAVSGSAVDAVMGSVGVFVSVSSRVRPMRALTLSSRSPAMMTIRWVAYSIATGGMLMMVAGAHAGSSSPLLMRACNALPPIEQPENRTSPAHGYQPPRMWPFLKPHVAHVHNRIVPSTQTGPPQLRYGLMPQETNTRRNASKLRMKAIRPMTSPAVMPGHILTLVRSVSGLVLLLVSFMVSFLPVCQRRPCGACAFPARARPGVRRSSVSVLEFGEVEFPGFVLAVVLDAFDGFADEHDHFEEHVVFVVVAVVQVVGLDVVKA